MSGVLFIDTAARDAITLAVIAMHLHAAYDASGGPSDRPSRYCEAFRRVPGPPDRRVRTYLQFRISA
jgi:hypothetical protein